MLTSFRVHNFKVFEDTQVIQLAPLTLISGINSAGKSSIIQALLLLKQTLESPPALALSPGRGRLLEQSLGDNFNDFIFGRPSLENAALVYHLSFRFDPEDDFDIYAACQKLCEEAKIPYPDGNLTAVLKITFKWGAFGHRGRPTVRVSELRISLRLNDEALVGLQIYPAETGGIYVVEPILDDCIYFVQKMPLNYLEIDGLSNFLPDALIIGSPPPLFKTYSTSIPVSFTRLFRDCFAAIRRNLSDEIYYLNSFREPPQRVYTTGQTSGRVLSPDGSNVAELLWQLRDEEVEFVNPSMAGKKRLPVMVDYILREVLGLEQSVSVEQVSKDILQVKVLTLGPEAWSITLSDVGLGYNQVLPLVVQGLLTPPGGLVIFEQPEIHLHPDVQAKLISFFIGLAKSGRRVLVETHSSHMVEHLCLAIVQDHSNWLVENAQTLFVHPPDENHLGARIEPIHITPYGEIRNWPPHFLPDIAELDDQIIRAAFAKQQVKSE